MQLPTQTILATFFESEKDLKGELKTISKLQDASPLADSF